MFVTDEQCERALHFLRDRFMQKFEKGDTCWNWTACITKDGYGSMRAGKTTMLAHRVAYQLFRGEIPEGWTIDHLCRNRRCVNPSHLEAVTRAENILRGAAPAAQNHHKTHCKNGHELSGDNLIVDSAGKRRCRTCRKKYAAKIRATPEHKEYHRNYMRHRMRRIRAEKRATAK